MFLPNHVNFQKKIANQFFKYIFVNQSVFLAVDSLIYSAIKEFFSAKLL